jgi:tetratricopeptide (TPR) repeat protein
MELKEFEIAIEKLKKLFEKIPKLKYAEKLALCYESIDDIDTSIDFRIKAIELIRNSKKYDKNKLIEYINQCVSFAKINEKFNHLPSWIIDLANDNK